MPAGKTVREIEALIGMMFVILAKITALINRLTLLTALFIVSTAFARAQEGHLISDIPCIDVSEDRHEKLVGWASANDTDADRAQRKAVLLARDELARSVGTLTERFAETFTKSLKDTDSGAEGRHDRYFSVQSDLTAELLRGVEIICEEKEYRSEGIYTAYAAVRVGRDFFLQSCRRIALRTEGDESKEAVLSETDSAVQEILGN